jgi:Rrf2 family iron-sulfur cluster assembly transcriptional regulator
MESSRQGVMRLTHGAGYALKAMAGLARAADERPVALRELARRERIPSSFLAKVARSLVKAQLLSACSGPGGGVGLARAAGEIRILDIVEACDGSLQRQACLFDGGARCLGVACATYCLFRREEDRVREALARVSLADFASSLVPAHSA